MSIEEESKDLTKKIIEINGIKLEVDLTKCKVITQYKVGDKVKVLVKDYSSYKSCPGIIIGFDNFKVLPTIIIAYLNLDYSSAELVFVYINNESKDIEICSADKNEFMLDKGSILEKMNRVITTKEVELEDLKAKTQAFVDKFNCYFSDPINEQTGEN